MAKPSVIFSPVSAAVPLKLRIDSMPLIFYNNHELS
jgi:hypothetical protein